MPKIAKPLTDIQVRRISRIGWHAVGGVAGLLLQVRKPSKEGAQLPRSWILRVKVGDQRQPIGLGSYPQVSLAEAREMAKKLVIEAKQGVNLKQKRKRYAGGRDRRGQIPNRRPLSERPLHIEARKHIGHWECDTVIGASHKDAVVTMVEHKSGYAVLAKVSNKTSKLVSSAIVSNLKPFSVRVKTLTYDNGKEFAGHSLIDQELNSTAYFARPFASWERGSNENLNGLLRQYIPKKPAMSTVSDEEIRMIQNRLNNRPRKRLGFKTPAEVFHQSLKRVALRT